MRHVIASVKASPLRRLILLVAVFLPAIALLAWADFDTLQSAREAVKTRVAPALGLALERSGQDLRLSWNSASPPLSRAADAELVIDDGSHENQLLLSPAQIRSGSILYSPFTGDVCFRLRAYDRDRRPVSETLRVVDSASASEVAETGSTGYAERSSIRPQRVPAIAKGYAPGTVIVRATTVRDAAAHTSALAVQPAGWRHRLWPFGRKLEYTENVH